MKLPDEAEVLVLGVALVGDQLLICPAQFRAALGGVGGCLPEGDAEQVCFVYRMAAASFGVGRIRSVVLVKTDLTGGTWR